MKYPDDMDADCIVICDALNALPGISTIESCCGHGKEPFRVFFFCTSFGSLGLVAKNCYSSAWEMHVHWINGIPERLCFVLEGPIGPASMPGGADDLASWIASSAAEAA